MNGKMSTNDDDKKLFGRQRDIDKSFLVKKRKKSLDIKIFLL